MNYILDNLRTILIVFIGFVVVVAWIYLLCVTPSNSVPISYDPWRGSEVRSENGHWIRYTYSGSGKFARTEVMHDPACPNDGNSMKGK